MTKWVETYSIFDFEIGSNIIFINKLIKILDKYLSMYYININI